MNMSYRTFAILLIAGMSLISCGDKSKLAYFSYQGYCDSIYSTVQGEVYEVLNKKDTVALPNATIKAVNNNKGVLTDAKGSFRIDFENGMYDLIITKQGYQPLKITGYISYSDQVASARIILARGNQQQTASAPKWGK